MRSPVSGMPREVRPVVSVVIWPQEATTFRHDALACEAASAAPRSRFSVSEGSGPTSPASIRRMFSLMWQATAAAVAVQRSDSAVTSSVHAA